MCRSRRIRKTQLTAQKQLMAWKMSLTACETRQKRHQEMRVGPGALRCIPDIPPQVLLNKEPCCTCDLHRQGVQQRQRPSL